MTAPLPLATFKKFKGIAAARPAVEVFLAADCAEGGGGRRFTFAALVAILA